MSSNERQIEGDDSYGGISYRDVTLKEAEAIFKDCPPDESLLRENESVY